MNYKKMLKSIIGSSYANVTVTNDHNIQELDFQLYFILKNNDNSRSIDHWDV